MIFFEKTPRGYLLSEDQFAKLTIKLGNMDILESRVDFLLRRENFLHEGQDIWLDVLEMPDRLAPRRVKREGLISKVDDNFYHVFIKEYSEVIKINKFLKKTEVKESSARCSLIIEINDYFTAHAKEKKIVQVGQHQYKCTPKKNRKDAR